MSKANSLKALPYAVLGFQIEHFGGIKKTEVHDLPNSAKWIFLTGENGYGKTTVLQAVAAEGFSTCQYNMACSGLDSLPDEVDDAAVRAIAKAVQSKIEEAQKLVSDTIRTGGSSESNLLIGIVLVLMGILLASTLRRKSED